MGLADVRQDVRYALRTLRRSPGFAIVAVLTLALGIGATTAIYSVVDTILLQPLPFPDSDRLVRVVENFPQLVPGRPPMQRGITHQEFLDWRGTREDVLRRDRGRRHGATHGADSRRARRGCGAPWPRANTFALLQVRAMLGRTLVAGDDANPDVVVLSYDTWRRHFNADPAVVGTALEFRTGALHGADSAAAADRGRRAARRLRVSDRAAGLLHADRARPCVEAVARKSRMIARLAPGVSLDAAIDEVNRHGHRDPPAVARQRDAAHRAAIRGPESEGSGRPETAARPSRVARGGGGRPPDRLRECRESAAGARDGAGSARWRCDSPSARPADASSVRS